MSPGTTMERVYLDLKARILSGAYPPGTRLEAAQLDPLKRGKAATISVLPFGAPKEEMVKLPLSLAGFTAGMTALVEANKAATAANPEANTAAPNPAAPAAAPAPAAPQQ